MLLPNSSDYAQMLVFFWTNDIILDPSLNMIVSHFHSPTNKYQ